MDRAWLIRGVVALLAVALLVLIAKVSMMAFGGIGKRLERNDPGYTAAPAKQADAAREGR